MVSRSALKLLVGVVLSTALAAPASAEDWRASGVSHLMPAQANELHTFLAKITITITGADGLPVLGLKPSDFDVLAAGCPGPSLVKTTIAAGAGFGDRGDYIMNASEDIWALNDCDGFVVKVIAKGTPRAPSFRQRMSVFVPLKR